MTVDAGEFGTVSLRIAGHEISVWKEFRFTSNFLTPCDSWHFVVGDDLLSDELLDLLVAGSKVEFFIDGIKQATGYIDVVDIQGDAHSGTEIVIEGRDSFSPVVDSQIDPDHKYPDKTNLETLIKDVLTPFGFTSFDIDNAANVEVMANKASKARGGKRRRRAPKKGLSQYPIPKKKPQHNDSFFVFLSRITQRYGLWIWPTVDGDGVIVGKPDYDQDPMGQLRRKRDGAQNNIISGGIRRDASDQPTFIRARGAVPPTHIDHFRTVALIGNPYDDAVGRVLGFRQKTATQANLLNTPANQLGTGSEAGSFNALTAPARTKAVDDVVANLLGVENAFTPNSSLSAAGESGTFNSTEESRKSETLKFVQIIQAKPIELANAFASSVARPRYIRDPESHTLEELANFAKRQMSLCVRKAFVAKYKIEGFKLNDQIVQVDTIVDVDDEKARFKGPLWVLARTFSQNRSGGTMTDIELLPLFALFF